jgi:polyisoprenoid-binding protein YceI
MPRARIGGGAFHFQGASPMRKLLGLVLIAAVAVPVVAQETKFALTGDNTQIKFVGTKKDGKHDGGFKVLTGTATVKDGDPTTAKLEVEIDLNSTYTDVDKLTKHLLSPDFFGVKTNPKSKFVSTKIEKSDKGFNVTGDLTLNGKTKSVTFPAQITAKDGELGISADFTINRTDFGITYGKGMINDDVALKVKVAAKK